ncbi:MAG: ABC transporter permease [Chloroflexota bacterium]|nr:MAG: ABC transporter permease [Chloroflexota bacterium]
MRALILARFTLREALRKRVLLGVLALSVIFLAIYGVAVHFGAPEMYKSMARAPRGLVEWQVSQMLLAGLWVVNFLSGLLVVFTSVGTIAGEVESGTFHAVASKPIRRWEIVVGKWLGHGVMVMSYVLLMFLVIIGLMFTQAGYLPGNIPSAIGTLWLEMLVLLSLSILASSLLGTVTAGIVVFMLYGIGTVGGMINWIAAGIQNETMGIIGGISGYLVPSDALWRHAARSLDVASPLPVSISPFSGGHTPTAGLIPYALVYTAVMVALAALALHRRDL